MANEPADPALPRERQERILERLRRHGRVIAADLAVEFRVSEDSIRRDLRELAARSLCKRVYGGALLATVAPPLAERRREDVQRKRALAAVALGIHAIHFRSPAALREELIAIGLVR